MAAYHGVNTSTQDKNINVLWDKVIDTWKKRKIYSQIPNLAFSSQVFNSKTNT